MYKMLLDKKNWIFSSVENPNLLSSSLSPLLPCPPSNSFKWIYAFIKKKKLQINCELD